MKKIILLIILSLTMFASAGAFAADKCYVCEEGSSKNCLHYCKYDGKATKENVAKCIDLGCKVGKKVSCPKATNYEICSAVGKK